MLKKAAKYLDKQAEKNQEKVSEEESYKEKLIASPQKEGDDAFNKEIIEEMSDFIKDLNMKELGKLKKMVLKFDGNTMKAFRCFRTIKRSETIEWGLRATLFLGIILGWNWLIYIGLLAFPAGIFHYSLIMTKGNKVLAGVISLILGWISMYIIAGIFISAAL